MLLAQLLDTLEAFHGPQKPNWPTDPYLFLVWWHSGYPQSDDRCAKGFESLRREIGVSPAHLLAADPRKLAGALKPGGMVPELRAIRLREIAERVVREFNGDLRAGLSGKSVAQIRAALKKFHGIADAGADRILLFGGISPVAAVPSNVAHVLARIKQGQEREVDRLTWGATYRAAQEMIEADVPEKFDPRMRAYLLLKVHGQALCKRTNPKCGECPVAGDCAFFSGKTRGRASAVRK